MWHYRSFGPKDKVSLYVEILLGARFYEFPSIWYSINADFIPTIAWLAKTKQFYPTVPSMATRPTFNRIFLCDTIATGKTMVDCIKGIYDYGFQPDHIVIFSLAASKKGLARILSNYRDVVSIFVNSELLHLGDDDWSLFRSKQTPRRRCILGDFSKRFIDPRDHEIWMIESLKGEKKNATDMHKLR